MAGYLAVFILVMGVSVYAILKLHQFNSATGQLLRINHGILDYKEKLNASILAQLQYERKYIITKDATFYDRFLSAKEEFGHFFSEVLALADTSEKRESLRKMKTYFGRYLSLTEEEFEQVRRNRLYPRRYYEEEIQKSTDGILEELKKLEAYSGNGIRHQMRRLEKTGASARKWTLIISAITIFLAIAISLFITRGFTKPLTLLMNKTREISRGGLNSDLDISSPPEISELAGSFNAMVRQLKAVDKMKSDFFSVMSHELRTPLTSIKEGISLLQDGMNGAFTQRQKKLLSILTVETHRLIGYVNSLLDLSKMEAGMMTFHFEEGSLSHLIEKALTEIVPLVESKRIRLEAKMTGRLPITRMDGERILQVLRNLIGNAVKFTPEGGQVIVSARPTDRGQEVSVADTGPGIAKENMATIFEKFHQASASNSNRLKGTGLGLAIVKHIITAHEGKVWAESEPGKGSTFIFVLPT